MASADSTEGPRLQITAGMRKILDYPRFRGPTRMLILDANYFFESSWRRAAESLGWETASVPSAMTGGLTREDVRLLFTAIGEFKPDFILASNFAGMDTEAMFSRFFEDARIPYVSWFTDTPRMILYDRKLHCSPYMVAATWERAYIPHFKQLGFRHIHFMPLATDPAVFQGKPSAHYGRNLAFVGTSMIAEAGEAWEKLGHLPEITAAIQDAFTQGRVTRERFAEGIEAVLDPMLLTPCTTSERRHIELCLIYEATRRQRAEMVQRLSPMGIEVRGDAAWQRIYPAAGGSVAYHSDLAEYYRTTAVNLNITSLQMKTAVNQRVFDCPAAGGFLLTDAQSDIAEFFDSETEMAVYASFDELTDKAEYYLRHAAEREAMIERAQRRIAAHHTHAHRLRKLESFLKEHMQAAETPE
ncbi:MAG TPA: glycosyltransferase [Candidatus Hydrogenedentes bacterium]|nr:glycosyltransferase [Candidatus Hydrogenedentota bacterium]HOV72655.1 glycosyltransferase [Candidatus Hydrogenedentota bacterium]